MLNDQLFLYGYSQGGHATMAAHREIDTYHLGEFTVTASAPAGGSYDMGGVFLDDLLANQSGPTDMRDLFPVLVAGYLPIYNLAGTMEELLSEPYRTKLPPLLIATMSDSMFFTLDATVPTKTNMVTMLRDDLYQDVRTNTNSTLRRAMRDNNTYDWTPKAPMKLFHSHGDEVIIFANAEVAFESFTNHGACCVELIDPGAPQVLTHEQAAIPSLRAALAWFVELKH
jgi:hypothetical protein